MDNFSKQKIAEQQYANLKGVPVEQYDGDYDKPHYHDIKASKIVQNVEEEKETFSTKYKENFEAASRDFWKKYPEAFAKYNAGNMVGKFGANKIDNEDFFKRLSNMIKEVTRIQMSSNGYTSENLKEHFVNLDSILKIISKELIKTDNEKKVKTEDFAAFLHGFINAYIDDIIKEKIEDG